MSNGYEENQYLVWIWIEPMYACVELLDFRLGDGLNGSSRYECIEDNEAYALQWILA